MSLTRSAGGERRAAIAGLLTDLKRHYEALSVQKCDALLQAKIAARISRTTADQDAKKVFEGAPLAGIGSESWRLLWDAARKYSTEFPYRTAPFPNIAIDARCVLCQRELDRESRDRFQTFEKFVKGELQEQAAKAERTFQTVEAALPDILTTQAVTLKMDAAGISDVGLRAMVTEFSAALENRKQTCLAAETQAEVTDLPAGDVWTRLDALTADMEKQAIACDEDAKGQNRPQLDARARELSARKWLNQQRQAIDSELTRLVAVQKLRTADALTNTTALSRRKSTLAEDLITNAYIQRFKAELKTLKAERLLVELKKTRADVGRVYHQIALRNATRPVTTSEILSEGEFRIVSLAAFLADTEGRGAKTPFIFDDPISSLDQVYEDATAQRLVTLSRTRQVIVFTHRLSLLVSLQRYADAGKVDHGLVCLSTYIPGEIVPLPIEFQKTEAAVNTLLNERLASARKALTGGDPAYEREAKSICRDIRVLIERIVEADLTGGIIKRLSPEVNTKGKLHYLALITPEDCKFIDDHMTKYSRYEHSQPDEAPVALPKPDEIETDLKSIRTFLLGIQKRGKK